MFFVEGAGTVFCDTSASKKLKGDARRLVLDTLNTFIVLECSGDTYLGLSDAA